MAFKKMVGIMCKITKETTIIHVGYSLFIKMFSVQDLSPVEYVLSYSAKK